MTTTALTDPDTFRLHDVDERDVRDDPQWRELIGIGVKPSKSSSRLRRKHLPGEHDQDSHGHRGADLGILAGLSVMDADKYAKEYGTVVDERSILDADVTGMNLTARFFERGDAHVVIDLPGDRYQVMSEVDGAEGMRALSSDIRKMQHTNVPDREPTGDAVASTESPEHSLFVAKDDLGSIWLRPDGLAEDDRLELTEDEAWDFFDALEQLADSFEDEFNEDDDELEFLDEDEEPDESAGKSASKGASMATKSFNPTIKAVGQSGDQGTATFRIASYNEVDKDGDVTLPGFFGEQHAQLVPVHDWNHVPIGKGRIYEMPDGAYCDAKFNLKIPEARNWYEAIKFDMENPPALQNYSYGYEVLAGGSKSGQHSGRQVRYLTPMADGTPGVEVFEVSPVLQGAGTGTRTVSVKGRSMRNTRTGGTGSSASRAVKGPIPAHETKTVSRAWDRVRTENALPDDARPSDLRTVFAYVDPDGDPELKSSYSWPHHHGIGGPANLRACLIGIAALNGSAGADMGDAERKGIYDHLAGHFKDADREPPALRDRGVAATKQYDELSEGLAIISGLIDGAYSGAALRREKGRGLSGAKAELLAWMADDLTRLKSLLSNPVEPETPEPDDDEVASVFAASIARLNGISAA